jgi:membrane protease subunit HflK
MRTEPNFLESSLKTVVKGLSWLGLVVAVAILFSGVTFVRQDEVALVLRFGRLVGYTPAEQIRQPGLHFAFPYLVDQVIRVPVSRVQEVRVNGLFTERTKRLAEITQTGYALTGDENIVLISAVVKYQITDPIQYALRIKDPQGQIETIATSVLMKSVAGMAIDDVMIRAQRELELGVLRGAQERADQLELGVQLLGVEFVQINPPSEVRIEFDQVASAQVQKQTRIQQANEYREREIPRATAERNEKIRQAETLAITRIAQAQADVQEFYALVAEYRRNPKVLKKRVYLDKLNSILSNIGVKVILPSGEEHKVILPIGGGGQ